MNLISQAGLIREVPRGPSKGVALGIREDSSGITWHPTKSYITLAAEEIRFRLVLTVC